MNIYWRKKCLMGGTVRVKEQYSTLCNKTGNMLPFTFYHRNMLLILLVHWLLQRLDKDQRKKQKKQ